MKKLISLLLAVSLLAASTCAFAESLVAGGQRNYGDANVNGVATFNSKYLRDYSNVPSHLSVYRPGDVLSFKREAATQFKAGDVLTFISSKIDAADYTSSTVMFIDQVTVETDNQEFRYKIREGLDNGLYKLEIKMGSNNVKTFYYGVADPKVEIAYVDKDETVQYYYDAKDNKTYYFAAASLGTDKVTYNQIGVAEVGFDFGNENVFTMPASVLDAAIAEQEASVNWFFSIGVMDVTEGAAPEAEGALIDE
jgi:hypothetical protein